MLTSMLPQLYTRELEKLADEIRKYPREENVWIVAGEVSNSGGNLCLHICGNLRHFIGAVLGNTGYVRNRELEFSQKNIPMGKLIEEIELTIANVKDTLGQIGEEDLSKEYPLEVLGKKWETGFFLVHLLAHLSYHLGQINYHRRLCIIGKEAEMEE